MSDLFVGVDVGGTKAASAVVDRLGDMKAFVTVPSRGEGRSDASIVDAIWTSADRAVAEAGIAWNDITAVGLGAPGPVDPEKGLWWGSTNLILNDPPFPLAKEIERRSGCPAFAENDVKAGALGEYHFGRGRDFSDANGGLLFISVGTGLAASLIVGGDVFRGRRDAGELGHIPLHPGGYPCACGQQGCLETIASGRALVRWGRATMDANWQSAFRSMAGDDPDRLHGGMILEAAVQGDKVAMDLVDRLAEGIALSVIVGFRAFDPAVAVLGGGVVIGGGAYLFERIKEALNRISPRFGRRRKVEVTGLREHAGALGAAAVALKGRPALLK